MLRGYDQYGYLLTGTEGADVVEPRGGRPPCQPTGLVSRGYVVEPKSRARIRSVSAQCFDG